MFEFMEISEQVYKCGDTSKSNNSAEADHGSHKRKHTGGESTSPTNPEKGRSSKRKKDHAGHMSDWTTSAKTWLVHGPRHSIKEWKLLKE